MEYIKSAENLYIAKEIDDDNDETFKINTYERTTRYVVSQVTR